MAKLHHSRRGALPGEVRFRRSSSSLWAWNIERRRCCCAEHCCPAGTALGQPLAATKCVYKQD